MSRPFVPIAAIGMALLLVPAVSARPPQLPLQIDVYCAPQAEKYPPPPMVVPAAESVDIEIELTPGLMGAALGAVAGKYVGAGTHAAQCCGEARCCPCPNPTSSCWQSFVQMLTGGACTPPAPQLVPIHIFPAPAQPAHAAPHGLMQWAPPVSDLRHFPRPPQPDQATHFPPPLPFAPATQIIPADANGAQQRSEIRRLYEQADRSMQAAQFEAAYQCYQEIHLRSPNCRYGQAASQKMTKIEEMHLPRPMPEARNRHGVEPTLRTVVMPASVTVPAEEPSPAEIFLRKLSQAQELYHIAERCRRNGDVEKAYACYHEVTRLCPQSDYARRAKKHIQQIDSTRDREADNEPANGKEPLRLRRQSRADGESFVPVLRSLEVRQEFEKPRRHDATTEPTQQGR